MTQLEHFMVAYILNFIISQIVFYTIIKPHSIAQDKMKWWDAYLDNWFKQL